MESVEINKRSVRLFGEVFSADEELQVFSKIVKYSTFYLCVLSKSSMLYLCVLHFICCWGLLSKHFDILQTKALKSYYEKAGLSAEKKLEVLKVCQTLGIISLAMDKLVVKCFKIIPFLLRLLSLLPRWSTPLSSSLLSSFIGSLDSSCITILLIEKYIKDWSYYILWQIYGQLCQMSCNKSLPHEFPVFTGLAQLSYQMRHVLPFSMFLIIQCVAESLALFQALFCVRSKSLIWQTKTIGNKLDVQPIRS